MIRAMTFVATLFKSKHTGLRLFIIALTFAFVHPIAQAQPEAVALNSQASKNAAQNQGEVPRLEVDKPIERELAGEESHSYQTTLAEGQYLNVVVEQRGIDVAVVLFAPDGKQLLEVDSPSSDQGPKPLVWIAAQIGLYRLEVRSRKKDAKVGRYEIKLIELRAATANDRAYVEALLEAAHLDAEANKLTNAGQYNKALPLSERALELREKVLGAEHPAVATSLNNLGELYLEKGDYAKAGSLLQRGLAIREKALGAEHPDTANSLSNLGAFHYYKGDYAKAEVFWQQALAIREKALNAEHPAIATSVNNLAFLYESTGDYAKAEPLYQRALAINEKALGAEHRTTATALMNLANIYKIKADYTKAEPLLQRALAIYEKVLRAEHPSIANALISLASIYKSKGDYAKAETFLQRALAIREKALGAEHPDTAIALNDLGVLYNRKGDYAKARPLLQRELAIYEKALGADHPDTAMALNSLAYNYDSIGDYANAEPLYLRALAIREKALGLEHPVTAESLNNIAMLYNARGDVAQAIAFRSRASAIEERNIALNTRTGSERQKSVYLATLTGNSEFTVSLHARSAPNDAAARDLALTVILQRKGRTLDAMADSVAALRRRASAQDQALLDQLQGAQSQLARLVLNGPQETTPSEHRTRINNAAEQVEKLEADVSRRSSEFRGQSQPVTIVAVQAAIPANVTLVEFFSYEPFDAKDRKRSARRYIAYELRRQGDAQWVDLGEAKKIDEAVAKLRQALRDRTRRDVKPLARTVDRLVMQPLRPLLGKTRRVLLSPDGALNLVPFAALVDENNRYLVKRYEFSYLTSGRDLLRLQVRKESKQEQGQSAMVVADPDFGEAAKDGKARKRGLNLTYRPGTKAATGEGALLAGYYFPPLSGTADEAQALKAMMRDATVLVQAQATETALKRMDHPRILHIATHGFFLENQPSSSGEGRGLKLEQVMGDREPAVGRNENPLLRSGLALAGANLGRGSDEDDGILTAQEAAGLNLWGTKLVVLSACDTGVGEVKTGEGVYGLRRALVLAGSETQVMSLWPVSDRGTRDLMIGYYQALQQGVGRSAALRDMQLRLLKRPDRAHPYYWASFIQSGEWASLEGKRRKTKEP
ncbi:MAG: tetratricopeptide repeat protein [Pyrinomonadaceae bacterium]|nr:tetratricopeptide repeat protein [Pyrinomonadaceae bacterium]